MNSKKIFTFLGFVVLSSVSLAQTGVTSLSGVDDNNNNSPVYKDNLINIIPASPNAASLGTYGNTPVSLYTGTPNVSVPIYQIKTSKLDLPISISHHGGGIKVEEIASWVGLGWSLNAGGAITRTVKGIPDEATNGFMNYQELKVQFIIDHFTDPQYETEIKDIIKRAHNGYYDLEPDIYSFNFGNFSGKFYYDQETSKFYTIPRSNLAIETLSNGEFRIKDEEGNNYYFAAKEMTNSGTSFCTLGSFAPPQNYNYGYITTAWFLTKITNATEKDIITLSYSENYYSYTALGASEDYVKTAASYCMVSGSIPEKTANHCLLNISMMGQVLNRIDFSGGYLKFISETPRSDLQDNNQLDRIELYNSNDALIKSFAFDYGYYSGRLALNKVTETSQENNLPLTNQKYQFEYNSTTNGLPDRTSKAQDHWGFYNGADANPHLLPGFAYTSIYTGNTIWWPGADRKVNESFNQAGTLKKIIYPTGGSSEFIYESNEVDDPDLDPRTIMNQVHIEGDHNGGQQTQYESAPFTINEPPNVLNGNNSNGGTFMSFHFEAIGNCYTDCSSPATTCALLTLKDANTGAVVMGPFTCNRKMFLQNGTYKLSATFQESPGTLYEDFYFDAKWETIDPAFIHSRLAGGLRIKQIIESDNINPANNIIKNYTYNRPNESVSSGLINGAPTTYNTNYELRYLGGYFMGYCVTQDCSIYYIKRNSYSNYPLLNMGAGYVGYSNVTVSEGAQAGANGRTEYDYTNVRDLLWGYPHPFMSKEWHRGQLVEERQYRKDANSFSIVKSSHTDWHPYSTGSTSLSYVHANILKTWIEREAVIGECAPSYAYQVQEEYKQPFNIEFEISSDYNRNAGGSSTIYDESDPNRKAIQTTTVDNNDLNYQPASIATTTSTGETITEKIKYSLDYNTSWGFIGNLLALNMVATPIERYKIRKLPNGQEFVIGGMITTYKTEAPLPDKIYTLHISAPIPLSQFTVSSTNGAVLIKDGRYVEDINFPNYNADDNLVTQQKTNDLPTSYIYGYRTKNLIASVTNANYSNIAATSFEDNCMGNWTFNANGIVNGPGAVTGIASYNLSYGLSTSGLDNTKLYMVSYWSKNGPYNVMGSPYITGRSYNGWTNYVHKTSSAGSIIISGNGQIDEVRVYPENALMTTYTYDPLVGVKSVCDPNNRILYYQYDVFGRLILIRDQDNNIAKKFCYNYAGQPDNCGVACTNFNPDWQNTNTPPQCQQQPPGVNTGILLQEQVDLNQCSPTFNQTRWISLGQNTSVCPLPNMINLTSTNSNNLANYIATYTNAIGTTYSFNVSTSSGLQSLGTVPEGTYTLTIYRTTAAPQCVFKSGCPRQTITGSSATFYNINVSATACNSISIALDVAN